MPRFSCALLASALISGCATPPAVLFEDPAFTVTVPEGWKSGKVEGPAKSRNYNRLEIRKKAGAAIAEVNITWYDEVLDLRTTIAERTKSMEDIRFFKLNFGEVTDAAYGKYRGLTARSNQEKWKVELQVEMYCFHAGGKTFVVWTGDAVEDLGMHAAGFRLIEDSFSVR